MCSRRYSLRCAPRPVYGVSAASIERLAGVHPRSQRRMATDSQHRVGRPGLALALRQELDALLAAEPTLPTSELLRRLRSYHGYTGGKIAIYDHVRLVRPPRPALRIVRFEGVAGPLAGPTRRAPIS